MLIAACACALLTATQGRANLPTCSGAGRAFALENVEPLAKMLQGRQLQALKGMLTSFSSSRLYACTGTVSDVRALAHGTVGFALVIPGNRQFVCYFDRLQGGSLLVLRMPTLHWRMRARSSWVPPPP